MNYKTRKEWFLDSEPILATIPMRIIAILIDIFVVLGLLYLISSILDWMGFKITEINWANLSHIEIKAKNLTEEQIHFFKIFLAFVPTIYFALITFLTNGQTVGKKVVGIRIVSIYHQRIGLWHCIERSLGYVASALELGLGFIQVLWNPNRMTLHDRIAETIVVKSSKKKKV